MRNRRIGTSISGIVQAMNKFGNREFLNWCDKGYSYLRHLDDQYSNWLCIPKSLKISTTKPSGSVSLLPGVTPGIHRAHSEYYIRNIRMDKNSNLVPICKEAGYPIESDKYSKTSVVISFPVHEKYYVRGKEDVSMWEQLELAAQMQYYWSDNSVSITVTFKPDEASQIAEALSLYETRLKSVSFLPVEDHGYEQAPYIKIDEKEYQKLVAKIKPLKIKENENEVQEKFCDGEACEIIAVKS